MEWEYRLQAQFQFLEDQVTLPIHLRRRVRCSPLLVIDAICAGTDYTEAFSRPLDGIVGHIEMG